MLGTASLQRGAVAEIIYMKSGPLDLTVKMNATNISERLLSLLCASDFFVQS